MRHVETQRGNHQSREEPRQTERERGARKEEGGGQKSVKLERRKCIERKRAEIDRAKA